MDKLRIGIIIYEESLPTEGGAHSYYDKLLNGINQFDFSPNIEIINIVFYRHNKPNLKSKKQIIYIKNGLGIKLKETVKQKTSKYSKLNLTRKNPIINFFATYVTNIRNKRIENLLKRHHIDLIYYLKPQWEVFNYSFIATHWDNCHKSVDPFPEIALNGIFDKREKFHLYTLNKAFIIFCESKTGAEELRKFYTINENKLKVLPIFAGDVIDVEATMQEQQSTLTKYNVKKERFFLYPAQFWAHKNHYNLILAFRNFISEVNNQEFRLILCGSDKGNLRYIEQLVQSLSLSNKVLLPGFISMEELAHLYKNAAALVMPTFLGPTNIPLIEAAHLNCPVLCSDLEGHKEILGDNAIYFQPKEIKSIVDAMQRIQDKEFRDELIKSANLHIKQSDFNIDHSLNVLNRSLCEIIPVRKTWGTDYTNF